MGQPRAVLRHGRPSTVLVESHSGVLRRMIMSCSPRSDFAQHRNDSAVHRNISEIQPERVHGGVGRFEHYLVAVASEPSDGRFSAGDARRDDVSVVGGALNAADQVVAVKDPGDRHRRSPHAQHEQLAGAGEIDWHRQKLSDCFRL